MNRLTRQLAPLNSPKSLTPTINSLLPFPRKPRTQRLPFPFLKLRKFTFLATGPLSSLKPDPTPPQMESTEDFVHVDNPTPEAHLRDSIVNLDEELKREEEPEEEKEDQNVAVSDNERKLPEELSRSVVFLTCESSVSESGTCCVYLVGTAHVSLESCKEVQAVINYLKPEVVFLELCSSRVAVLTPQNLKIPTMGEMMEMYKKNHNIFGILYSWFLAKVASKLEVFPGSEFRMAYEEARKYGAKVILGDRPVQITLRRTWAQLPLWHKIKLLFSFVFQSFFLPSAESLNKMLKEMDDADMLTLVIQEMSRQFPTLMETLVHERDQYMSSRLLGIARENSSVVAVVGKGHLQGMKNNWKKPIELKGLLEIPSEKSAFSTIKVLASIGAGVAGVAIISGFYLAYKK